MQSERLTESEWVGERQKEKYFGVVQTWTRAIVPTHLLFLCAQFCRKLKANCVISVIWCQWKGCRNVEHLRNVSTTTTTTMLLLLWLPAMTTIATSRQFSVHEHEKCSENGNSFLWMLNACTEWGNEPLLHEHYYTKYEFVCVCVRGTETVTRKTLLRRYAQWLNGWDANEHKRAAHTHIYKINAHVRNCEIWYVRSHWVPPVCVIMTQTTEWIRGIA